ncbi:MULTISPECIES: L,D-transpeptidase [Pelosinus]|uniref:ErfK/YbiS/YcfS/YnhG family protein n=1 Tax=Pelosinus fermentans B4 TaxID=1149862 RepID=I9B1C9_9FIRM|nr:MULTISPECIES: L,D-transpeptidase [Pelosinus]EIW18937.1 ErfK/YbiS/YcfS/YnhG family protein [Pelosinus fermentans B4]EIW21852.1 ErfK/YbiS/YcfS/YnhG family protein [Pelosinus fermentans A11]OAM95297.1 ErfK/YbiS/YcfS/YnhG family protein [Pelosinus fermentans DSM 17108]SDR26080.1 L,D-transpeptidase ErfK/SrfK [Pelosinus fermentans]
MRILMMVALLLSYFQAVVWASPEIRINIPELMLRVYDNGKLVKEYPVALGTSYEKTPVGNYKISYKEQNPTWIPGSGFSDKTPVPPGPDNPLGSRWMEFSPGYGIHGTNKDWDIQYPVSGGCIRMHNTDVEELYELVDVETPVTVTYQTLILKERNKSIYLTVLPDIYHNNDASKAKVSELFKPYAKKYKLLTNWDLPNDQVRHEIKIGERGKG